jgi:hypothetical protein
MGSSCLAVSFCVDFYTSGVVVGYGFNLSWPCNWYFEDFSLLDLQHYSPEKGMLDMLPFAGFLLWCQLPLFSPQQGGWSS